MDQEVEDSNSSSHRMENDIEIKLQKEADDMRNEIVLDVFHTYRLLGWTDQEEEDYYWIVQKRNNTIVLYSCVGSFIKLKDSISDKDYAYIENIWNMNNASVEDGLKLAKEKRIIIK